MVALLKKRRPDLVVPEATWRKPWVVHCTPWGNGADAVLQYLARYVFRIAITSSRIVALDDSGVTIRYRERTSGRWLRTRLRGDEFMRRFLQHVLPKGLHKVRYYGLWHPSWREQAARARLVLLLQQPAPRSTWPAAEVTDQATDQSFNDAAVSHNTASGTPRVCPYCKLGHLVCIGQLYPKQATGP